MNQQEQQQQFDKALQQVETCLETPFVPGELEAWFESLKSAFDELEPVFREQFKNVHKSQLAEIVEEDPGLQHRADQIARVDADTIDQFEKVRDKVTRLSDRATTLEPDEARMKEECYRLVDEGLAFVILARKQEVSVRTWLVEALERDRGVVD